MYCFETIAFRVVEKEDLDVLRRLHNQQDTYLNLYNIDFADEWGQLAWWEGLHRKKDDRRFVLCFANDPGTIIGRLRIQNIHFPHNNCEIGLDILPEYRNQGLGTLSYRMVLEFVFEHLNMHMAYIRVADFNPLAKIVYDKAGFKETGRLPEYFFRHGKYHDYVIMAITASDYEKSKPTANRSGEV